MRLFDIITLTLHIGKPREVKKPIQGNADEELIVKFQFLELGENQKLNKYTLKDTVLWLAAFFFLAIHLFVSAILRIPTVSFSYLLEETFLLEKEERPFCVTWQPLR